MPLPQTVKHFVGIALLSAALAACSSKTSSSSPAASVSSEPTIVPRMGVVTEVIAGQQRLFSTFGFWMMGDPLKTQLLGCFRPDGTLDPERLKATFPEAEIVVGTDVVAVALPTGDFTFFLLRDGPLVSLDPKFDGMVQQMSSKASTP